MPKPPPRQSPQSFSTSNPENKTLNLVGNKNRGEVVSEVNDDNNGATQVDNKNIHDLLKIVFPRNYQLAEGKEWDLCEKQFSRNYVYIKTRKLELVLKVISGNNLRRASEIIYLIIKYTHCLKLSCLDS